MKHILFTLFSMLPLITLAADEEAALFYQSGKIYVVVGVLVIIFTGLAIFLWRLDRRVSKMEKEINQ